MPYTHSMCLEKSAVYSDKNRSAWLDFPIRTGTNRSCEVAFYQLLPSRKNLLVEKSLQLMIGFFMNKH